MVRALCTRAEGKIRTKRTRAQAVRSRTHTRSCLFRRVDWDPMAPTQLAVLHGSCTSILKAICGSTG
jgi:hypothetical protein